ncbi:MAG: hypothetical protein AABM29_08275 [Actinomycetota bacterium]
MAGAASRAGVRLIARRGALLAAVAAAAAIGLAACGGGDDDGASVEAFCGKVDQLSNLSNPFQDLNPGDVEGAKDAIDQVTGATNQIADVAPPEIQGDVETLQSFFESFGDQIADVETPQDLLGAVQGLRGEAQQVQGAGTRLQNYARENCSSQGS